MSKFRPVLQAEFAKQEQDVLKLWDAKSIFKRSIEQHLGKPNSEFLFYDGPPFATGLPHYGHFVASTIKDVVARYWAMRGKCVERRFGWDTHGLPIEMQTEKNLGVSGPTQIREYGIDKFNEACRSGVLKYTKEWEVAIKRLGRWVDFENDYKTMDPWFMESVWWVFGELWKKGLVYQGFRVMPFSWRLSTPLSNFEANMDYRDVQDPSLFVRFKLEDEPNTCLLVWTTTPWTLPGNLAVAVSPTLTYVRARKEGDDQIYIVAQERLETALGKDAKILSSCTGKELEDKVYTPLFSYFSSRKSAGAFKVVVSDHVSAEDGTGLVHMAPAFGQEDFDVCKKYNIELVDHVDDEGNIKPIVSDFAGLNVKDADPKIIRNLKERGLVYRHDTIQHSYPFCWRSGTPLIYKAVPVWCVRVTEFRDRMWELNQQIHWVPDAVGEKRFGNWLKDAQDWTISRNRFWGTPIPLWSCTSCGEKVCISSVQELEEKSGIKVTDLHSHHVDKVTFSCDKCSGTMKRIPEVFDCWFDSGAMPYAQMHYPFENKDNFSKQFPASFIAEGLDQTRGWFYTLVVLSTALFDSPPFKNVIVNGLVLAEDGSKMSKSKQNYPDPMKILESYGADALRTYLVNSPVVRAEPLLFSEGGVKEVVRMVLLPLYHTWSFFVQYANIDSWDPAASKKIPLHERSELDRWILSRLQSLVRDVNANMEGYYLYKVVPPMVSFIDDLTNWYVRRSRRRFWRSAADVSAQQDKECAYSTLYEVLVTFSKVIAPVLPFMAETLYQHLVVEQTASATDSVHLTDYPTEDTSKIDLELEKSVETIRGVVTMGRALREKHRIKTRQPLPSVTVVTHDPIAKSAIRQHSELIEQELNVKSVRVQDSDDTLCEIVIKPNFKTLGKRMGKNMKEASEHIAKWTRHELEVLQRGETISVLEIPLCFEDIVVTRNAKADVFIETEGALTVALDTHLTSDLRQEGLMREVVSLLQKLRKDSNLEVTDRITLDLYSESEDLREAIKKFQVEIKDEVLATLLTMHQEQPSLDGQLLQVEEHQLWVKLKK